MLYTVSQHRMTINQAENNEPDNKQHTHNSIMLYNIMPYGKEERWLLHCWWIAWKLQGNIHDQEPDIGLTLCWGDSEMNAERTLMVLIGFHLLSRNLAPDTKLLSWWNSTLCTLCQAWGRSLLLHD